MTYSSTLDGAITANTTDVFVDDAPTAPYPPFVQVGSELMAVVSVQTMARYPVLSGTRVRLAVQRGALGTTRATHSDASALYAVTPVVQTSAPAAPPASEVGGGAAQTVSLLGPFRVTYASVGLDGTGGNATTLGNSGYVDLGAIPDDANVIMAWAEPTIAFNGDGAGLQELDVSIQPANDPDNASSLAVWNTGVSVGPESGYALSIISNPATLGVIARTITGAHLSVTYNNVGGSVGPTAGEADIYALIATPA